ncbi:FxsA family protein [Pullulanibacillus sp. KACC 23026]|uniref:FxsA family protein n=1 Tax=Pullulanibacillus sp. KACC 23026 TaxID=3028315 RepID=UPI0023B1E39F|nr:FxsA family protein [Pullulanibacillus sp. KACC 23026]WEG13904.1 FxsA family protein [Pullulanibacillus sp. KACC 23026]
MKRLMPLFILVPLIELWLFFLSGKYIGILATIGIVLLTGVIGASLARREGLAVFHRAKEQLRMGRLPGEELIEGFLVLAGGLLLLTPGYLTDLTGLLLMIPRVRRRLVKPIRRRLQQQLSKGRFEFFYRR